MNSQYRRDGLYIQISQLKMSQQLNAQLRPLALGPLSDYYESLSVSGHQSFIIEQKTVTERVTTTIQRQVVSLALSQTWKTSFFRILMFVTRIKIGLLNSIRHKRPQRNLGHIQLLIINDVSHSEDFLPPHQPSLTQQTNLTRAHSIMKYLKGHGGAVFFKKFLRSFDNTRHLLIEKVKEQIGKISISFTFMKYWDIFQLILLLFEASLIPFSIAFDIPDRQTYIMIQLVPVLLFVIDIFINFFKGYYEKGMLVNEPFLCAHHYLYGRFLLDLITIITFMIAVFLYFRYLEYISLIRVVRMGNRYVTDIEENFNLQERWGSGILTLIKLIGFLFLSIHFIACLWIVVGTYGCCELDKKQSVMDSDSWMLAAKIENSPWHEQYISSFYFTVVTMITVGYGDIVPKNPLEMVFAIIIIFYTCGTFAYSINVISGIFSEFNKTNEEYRVQISRLNIFMTQRSIPDQLQRKVRRQLEYIYREKRRGRLQTDAVLYGISKSLKDEILVAVNLKIINKIHFFSDNFPSVFLESLSQIIKDVTIGPEDYIYRENDIKDLTLYFIEEGEVEIILEHKSKKTTVLQTVQSGDWFGEFSFFSNHSRETSARSKGVSYLNYILKEDLIKLFEVFPQEYQKFCELSESFTLYRQYQRFGIECVGCQGRSHQVFECPVVTYQPNRQNLIQKLLHTPTQIRQNYSKRRVNKFSTRIDKLLLLEGFQRFYDENEELYDNVDLSQLIDSTLFEVKETNVKQKFRMTIHHLARNSSIGDERKVQLFSRLRRLQLNGQSNKRHNLQTRLDSISSAESEYSTLPKQQYDIDDSRMLQPNKIQNSDIPRVKSKNYLQLDFDYKRLLIDEQSPKIQQTQQNSLKVQNKAECSNISPKSQSILPHNSPAISGKGLKSHNCSSEGSPSNNSTQIGNKSILMLAPDIIDKLTKVEDDFDQVHEFKYYRPDGNLSKILIQINQGYINQMHHLKESRLKRLNRFVHNAEARFNPKSSSDPRKRRQSVKL